MTHNYAPETTDTQQKGPVYATEDEGDIVFYQQVVESDGTMYNKEIMREERSDVDGSVFEGDGRYLEPAADDRGEDVETVVQKHLDEDCEEQKNVLLLGEDKGEYLKSDTTVENRR